MSSTPWPGPGNGPHLPVFNDPMAFRPSVRLPELAKPVSPQAFHTSQKAPVGVGFQERARLLADRINTPNLTQEQLNEAAGLVRNLEQEVRLSLPSCFPCPSFWMSTAVGGQPQRLTGGGMANIDMNQSKIAHVPTRMDASTDGEHDSQREGLSDDIRGSKRQKLESGSDAILRDDSQLLDSPNMFETKVFVEATKQHWDARANGHRLDDYGIQPTLMRRLKAAMQEFAQTEGHRPSAYAPHSGVTPPTRTEIFRALPRGASDRADKDKATGYLGGSVFSQQRRPEWSGINPGQFYTGQNANETNRYALQDYQMQLLLLEKQNRRRLELAKREAEAQSPPVQTNLQIRKEEGLPLQQAGNHAATTVSVQARQAAIPSPFSPFPGSASLFPPSLNPFPGSEIGEIKKPEESSLPGIAGAPPRYKPNEYVESPATERGQWLVEKKQSSWLKGDLKNIRLRIEQGCHAEDARERCVEIERCNRNLLPQILDCEIQVTRIYSRLKLNNMTRDALMLDACTDMITKERQRFAKLCGQTLEMASSHVHMSQRDQHSARLIHQLSLLRNQGQKWMAQCKRVCRALDVIAQNAQALAALGIGEDDGETDGSGVSQENGVVVSEGKADEASEPRRVEDDIISVDSEDEDECRVLSREGSDDFAVIERGRRAERGDGRKR